MLCLALDRLADTLDLTATVICQDDTREDLLRPGIAWRSLSIRPGGGKLGFSARVLGLCAQSRPEFLLLGHFGMTPLGALCRPFLRRGFGFVAHGMETWREPRWSRRAAARRARRVFAVSEDTGRAVCRSTGLDPARVRHLPNTLDPRISRLPASPRPSPAAGALEILTVSRLWAEERMKGVDHTLEAVSRLRAEFPGLKYRIVGKGSDKPRLQALASSLGLDGCALFEEDLSDEALAARYRDCSLFALPSGQEGFGIVFLEAMHFGRPVVAARAGGVPEVVADGRTGLLVPYGDVPALEAALRRLLGDAAGREAMGAAGRSRLEERFSYERFCDLLEGHLREWLAG